MNIDSRLQRLSARRRGLDRFTQLSEFAQDEVLAKAQVLERWQQRALGQPHTRYALGAMQELDPESTQISLRDGERVGKQLEGGLPAHGIWVEMELQGSVPLNVHIRGYSDVDLLVLDMGFMTYALGGAMARSGQYRSPTLRTSVEVLQTLRKSAVQVLRTAYPAVKVDITGAKSIALSGGSLSRKVDVVPAHWHDTIEYQSSGQKHDRAVTILDNSVPTTLDNLPFLHIRRVTERCNLTMGGLRKSIRLVKTVKADAEEEGQSIPLPSFDLAAIMYHANTTALRNGLFMELAVLSETQRHLQELVSNPFLARTLKVPDGSRFIFDSDLKLHALGRLSAEIDSLVDRVASEQNRIAAAMHSDMASKRQLVESAYIP